jgi:hypothetical protein
MSGLDHLPTSVDASAASANLLGADLGCVSALVGNGPAGDIRCSEHSIDLERLPKGFFAIAR